MEEVLQNNGDEWLVSVANMKPSATEDDDGIIDEVGSTIVVVFEYRYAYTRVGVLCSIYRVRVYTQFTGAVLS